MRQHRWRLCKIYGESNALGGDPELERVILRSM